MAEMRIVSERCVDVRKTPKAWVRVQIYTEDEIEHPGLDIREYIESDSYTGRTKHGIRIPPALIPDVIEALRTVGAIPKRQGM
jgi:hypothetical protein